MQVNKSKGKKNYHLISHTQQDAKPKIKLTTSFLRLGMKLK
jgi:hypothetical protein